MWDWGWPCSLYQGNLFTRSLWKLSPTRVLLDPPPWSKRVICIGWQGFMSAICQRDHPWGIPKQDDSVLGAVWCLTFPTKSALETKIRSPISWKSLVVSTWNFACEFLLTLSISWKKIMAIRKSHFSLQEYLNTNLFPFVINNFL